MKNEIRLALLCMAATAVPAFAQNATPQCGSTNFDSSRNAFTVMNPAAGAVNQQCFVTVYPGGAVPSEARQDAASYFVEGTYVIELSGGGGGGGGGASREAAGGGGGAGAAPSRTVQYLSPGVYKLTIGTGGAGGSADGGWTSSGNPTSLTNADTGQLIAGFEGADVWVQGGQAAVDGRGGQAKAGGSEGGSGGGSGGSKHAAQAGGMMHTAGNTGMPGQAGAERRIDNDRNAGGGGGASVGSGGAGGSANMNATAAGIGDFGGGGGGGRGGEHNTAAAGGQGGNGFIRLAMSEPAPQASAPAPEVVVARAPVETTSDAMTTSAPAATRPARRDRN